MSTRALRPKPVEIVEDDTWIWGNNRGGGGAPLKDIGGTPVANLRSVMKGSAQVDYSPSRSPIKTKSKHRAMSEEDDRYDIRESRKRREIDRGRDRDLSPDHGRARSPELVRGLENHYDAPIRHGRAIKDMHGTGPEKEARMRKELEYQAQLQEQIDEKKRRKEAEKRKEDEIKRIELEEFMANQKGPFRNRAAGGKPVDKHFETSDGHSGSPTRVKNKKVSYTDDRDSYESDRDDYRSGSTEQRRPPRRDSHDDADGRYGQGKQSNRRDPPHRSTNGRGGKYEEEVLSDDGYDDDYSNGRSSPPRQKRSLSDRSHDRGRGSRREDEYVTRAEYDDLALMYEDLQLEHRALKEEMTVQNELINELKLQMKSQPLGAAVGGVARREHRLRDKASAVKKAVAFGGAIKPHKPKEGLAGNKQPKDDRRPNSMSTIERKGKGVEGLGLHLPQIGVQKGDKDMRRRSQHSPVTRKPFAEQGRREEGVGVMSLLAKKGGGPIRVAYEAEDGSEGRSIHSPVTTKRGASVELRGESEYMLIRGDDEHLGGAQLDRLLQQAKNARAAPSVGGAGKKLPGGKIKKSVAAVQR